MSSTLRLAPDLAARVQHKIPGGVAQRVVAPKKRPGLSPAEMKKLTRAERKALARQVLADKQLRIAEQQQIRSDAAARHRSERTAHLATLQQDYPLLFNPAAPLPLALGIGSEIRTRLGLSVAQSNRLMKHWVWRDPYLRAVVAGGPRYALDGSECGSITAGQQAVAQQARLAIAH